MSSYLCKTCAKIYEEEPLPKVCAYCGIPSSHFKVLTDEEIKEIKGKNKRKREMVNVTEDSIAMRGYKPSGYSRTLF